MDLKKILVDTKGNPLKKDGPEGPDLTIEDMVAECLLFNKRDEKAEAKIEKYRLYKKVLSENPSISLKEKNLILQCAGEHLSTLVYGQISDYFDPPE